MVSLICLLSELLLSILVVLDRPPLKVLMMELPNRFVLSLPHKNFTNDAAVAVLFPTDMPEF